MRTKPVVNIPSNLQNTWNDIAKDGKLNREEIDRLKKEAVNYEQYAEVLDGKELNPEQKLELMASELDEAETDFIYAIESNKIEGIDLQVKNGSAPGSFELD